MKILLFILGVLGFVAFLVSRQRLHADVETAIQNHMAAVGMTEAQAKSVLGEPLLIKRTETLKGNEVAMTFRDGNMVTFQDGSAVKVETVKVNAVISELAKSPGAPARIREVLQQPTPEPQGAWMWKNYKNPLNSRR